MATIPTAIPSSGRQTGDGNGRGSKAAGRMQRLAEVARAPAFPDSEVKLAQANALQGLKAAEAQPGFKARRALAQAVYGDHPYGHTLPTEEAIKAVTPQQFRDAHARRFRADHALLVVTGRIEPAQAFALAQSAFGRSEEHTSELQSLMRTSYALFCWKQTTTTQIMTQRTERQ